jgi:hypothetical protein
MRRNLPVLLAAVICAGAWGQDGPGDGALLDTGDGWCTTDLRWRAKAGGDIPVGGSCPINGSCDVPELRDQYIPDALTPHRELRVHFVVFREDDGSNPAAHESDIIAQMEQFNADFAPWGISFVHTWQHVDDSTYRYGGNDFNMKAAYAVAPAIQCNVFVKNTGGSSYGTFPWDPDALTAQGGIVMHLNAFGAGESVLTHEMGHNLGLWHTHHGVSEVETCSACWERADGVNGDTTGDRCSDTPPTPVNWDCADPGGIDPCSGTPWGQTLVEDYMSYSFCWSLFTEQQGGRMHCWTEVVLRSWMTCLLTGGHETLAGAGGLDHRFGTALDASGTRAVAGADGDDFNGTDSGAASIYSHDGINWIGPQVLRPDDGAAGDLFGSAAAIDGDRALVGAPEDDGAGSAYVFQFDGSVWSQVQKLSDGSTGDEYGASVALSGDLAVVGAPLDDEAASDAGAAYVYRHDGSSWVLEQKLLGESGSDNFGNSVAVSGDAALVGAHLHDDIDSNAGAAYVYRHDGSSWSLEQKLTDPEGMGGDLLGFSVALDGTVAVAGAYRSDIGLLNTGSALAFRYDGSSWDLEARVSGGGENDQAGFAVDVSGDTIVAGTPQDTDNGTNSGSAHVFRYDGSSWVQSGKVLASDGTNDDRLGYAVAISDAGILAGAPFVNNGANDTGVVYAFGSEFPYDCNGNFVPDGCDIADGTSLDENANGIPDECEEIVCPWDLDGNGMVATADLLTLIGAWGFNPGHPADFDGNDVVGTPDLLALLANWGQCL